MLNFSFDYLSMLLQSSTLFRVCAKYLRCSWPLVVLSTRCLSCIRLCERGANFLCSRLFWDFVFSSIQSCIKDFLYLHVWESNFVIISKICLLNFSIAFFPQWVLSLNYYKKLLQIQCRQDFFLFSCHGLTTRWHCGNMKHGFSEESQSYFVCSTNPLHGVMGIN